VDNLLDKPGKPLRGTGFRRWAKIGQPGRSGNVFLLPDNSANPSGAI